MRFTNRRRRSPPAVILVSLIDILLVLLIFLMVTSTFQQLPSLRIALPESRQAKSGTRESNLVVTIDKQSPYFYLNERPVTLDKLKNDLVAARKANPEVRVAIRPARSAAVEQLYKVIDAAKEANIKWINAFSKPLED